MKKLLLPSALLILTFGFGQTPITDANFEAAITNCLATNPVDGLCSDSEYGAMPDWDVSQVTDMSDAFRFKTSFNADISAWDVSNVTDFGGMFYQARAFNQDISSWNVSNATTMGDMFNNARVFNQDISVWNVSNVTHMNGMFNQNYTFNIDLSAWDVSNVTNMAAMFQYALAFNQNLSSWNISNVNDLNSFGEGSMISVENDDAILTAWSALTLQQGVTFSSSTLQYCTAGDARQSIIDNFGWSITDAGLATGCNDFEWINYGTQDWTVENADMVTYRDGTPIPQVTDNTEWSNLTTGAWCYYDNDPTKGKLYNWYAVAGIHDNDPNTLNKELAPVGFHVPSDEEWTTLENYLIANGYNYDGTNTGNKIAKAMASTTGWNSSTQTGSVGNDQSQNNSSGFNAFPEGARYTETANYGNGSFDNVGRYAFFWSSTETGTNYAWYRDLVNDLSRIGRAQSYSGDGKQFGFSVRFVRDATSLSTTDFSNSIIMYPNPVKNTLTIDGLVVKDIVIYSVLGKAVLNISNQNTIDVSSLSKGVYFIKVSDGINASTKKFIKE